MATMAGIGSSKSKSVEHEGGRGLQKFVLENGLSLILVAIFVITWTLQIYTGLHEYNDDCRADGQPTASLIGYLQTGHFWEATGENWESEFLQMAAFIWLTRCFYQRGSPESNNPYEKEEETPLTERSPWPARAGGLVRKIYENSLTLAFLLMFAISFVIHVIGGHVEHNREQLGRGLPGQSLGEFLTSNTLWFQSMQNWQSEFLSILMMVVLTIFLRQKGSPESKKVNAANDEHE